MVGSPTDFNDCVSKGEHTTFITEQCNLMNELTRNVNNLVTRIEQIEQHPQSHRSDDEDEDADGDLSSHEDVDDDGDACNHCRYKFNHHGIGGNIMTIMILLLKLNSVYLLLPVMLILRHI